VFSTRVTEMTKKRSALAKMRLRSRPRKWFRADGDRNVLIRWIRNSSAHRRESASASQESGLATRDQSDGSVKSCPTRRDADSIASPLPLIAVTLIRPHSQALIMVLRFAQ
jgi:hypothetical protein